MPYARESADGCFCCSLPKPGTPHPVTGLPYGLDGMHSQRQPIMPGHPETSGPDPATLGQLLEKIHLHNSSASTSVQYSSLASSSVHSSQGIAIGSNHGYSDLESGHDMRGEEQADSAFISPASTDAVHDNISQFSFRYLQERQMGGGGGGRGAGSSSSSDSRPGLSSSLPSYNTFEAFEGAENSNVNNKKFGSRSMDLDAALDELGMLATITSSRRQYLLETRSKDAARKREQRMRAKSESSPNLSSVASLKGFSLLRVDPTYVTRLSSQSSPVSPAGAAAAMLSSEGAHLHHLSQKTSWRDQKQLESIANDRRRRSVPRMSRLRKDRYRHSRCPYKIPNRLCSSMQETDFETELCPSASVHPFSPSSSASRIPVPTSLAPLLRQGEGRAGSASGPQSKSTHTSPVKPPLEVRLVRSVSAENLLAVRRRLDRELDDALQPQVSMTDDNLDLVTSQMTGLNMT